MDHAGIYKLIYKLVAEIPSGRVVTYGQIAWMVGKPEAPRMVGYAMSHAPAEQNLPCHRVVNRLGELAPPHAFGGGEIQRAMLEEEGVSFLENGRIDLKRCRWRLSAGEDGMESP